MGILGIWQIIFGLLSVIVLPLLAIKFNREKSGMKRGRFVLNVIGIFVIALVFGGFFGLLQETLWNGVGLAIMTLVVFSWIGYLSYGLTVKRLNDAGWTVWLTYLQVVPMANILFTIIPMFVPSKAADVVLAEA